jgi:GNAT superfamily N-acetyltransferase
MAKKHLNLNQFQLSYQDSDERLPNNEGEYTPAYTTIRAFPNDDGSYGDDEALGTLTLQNVDSGNYSSKGMKIAENEVIGLNVDPEHRGKGVGSALVGGAVQARKNPKASTGGYLDKEQSDFVQRRLKNS